MKRAIVLLALFTLSSLAPAQPPLRQVNNENPPFSPSETVDKCTAHYEYCDDSCQTQESDCDERSLGSSYCEVDYDHCMTSCDNQMHACRAREANAN